MVVGLPPKGSTLTIDTWGFINEKTIRGCFLGSARIDEDIPQLVDLYASGDLLLDELVTIASRSRISLRPSSACARAKSYASSSSSDVGHAFGTIPRPTRATFGVTLESGWWERGAPKELGRGPTRRRVGRADLESAQLLQRDVAAHRVARLDLGERRLLALADLADLPRAARVEDAAGRGSAALGISPSSRMRGRSSPSSAGTAERSASVYGWCGAAKTVAAGPTSITRPR